MAEFSMELNDDQKTMQEWVHGFAVNQMRPIAAEWDERERPVGVHPGGGEDRHLLAGFHDERLLGQDRTVLDDRDRGVGLG